jgi:CheY-like chemotaxis protein
MAHGLAAQLGGALTIDSKPGLGTSVALYLPTTQENALIQPKVEGAALVATAGLALVVDDEEVVRASTADMLAELGYDIVEAGSAEEALRLLNEGLMPNLLITDHLMPGQNGTELARDMIRRIPGIRTLIVSGYAEVEGIAPDLPRLVKPFRLADLLAGLNETAED